MLAPTVDCSEESVIWYTKSEQNYVSVVNQIRQGAVLVRDVFPSCTESLALENKNGFVQVAELQPSRCSESSAFGFFRVFPYIEMENFTCAIASKHLIAACDVIT
jgi:hypothetical protein